MEQKYGQILGIAINSTPKAKVLTFVRSSLANRRKFYVVTPNPEIVLSAQKDKDLAKILNYSSISLPDGVGLAQAAKFLSLLAPRNKILRVPVYLFQGVWVGLSTFMDREWLFREIRPIKGREMFLALIRLANNKGWKVYFLGGKETAAREAAKLLEKNYKTVKIRYSAGPLLNNEGRPEDNNERLREKEAVEGINSFSPELLFIGFGAPKQEKWLSRWLNKLDIGGAMVVGGSFDYISGNVPLPPKWMEEIGLEWIWRLVKEPWRAGRIINALIIFPWKVFLYKLSLKQA